MKRNTALTPIASAVALLVMGVATSVHAQEADRNKAEPQQVTVTGIRSALQSAVNIKKNSNAVVDAVSAEDVGKLPDADVGESLGRIPGVSVARAFGQGSAVSVRGSDPQMTYTTLNGQTVASTGWFDQQAIDRSFNYSLLPSELIGGMEVYKSSQADLTEGGIGGTVIVKTRKPLDLKSGTIFAGFKTGKGSISSKASNELSGLVSWKNDSNNFGILLAGAKESSEYVRRGTETLLDWNGAVSPTTFEQDRKREALNLSAQFRPVDGVELGVNYLNLKLDADNANSAHFIFMGNMTCSQKNAAGACVRADASKGGDTYFQTFARQAKMTSESLNLNATYKTSTFKLEGVIGTTKADGGTSLTTLYGVGDKLPQFTGTVDATGKQISVKPAGNVSIGMNNLLANSVHETWAPARGPNSDKENYAQADVTFKLKDWGPLTSFKAGVRKADHTFQKQMERPIFVDKLSSVPTSSIYGGSIDLGASGWTVPKPNASAMLAATLPNIKSWVLDRSSYGKLNEDNTALYGMFDFEQDQWHGNFGLRYINTKVSVDGYKLDGTKVAAGDIGANNGWGRNLETKKADYSDVLPSFNLAYDVSNNVIVRAAAAQTVTRPNYENMFLSSEFQLENSIPGDERVTFGSPNLKPMKSTQFDIGVEYYYGKGNLVAATLFHKKIDNFVTSETLFNQKIGVVSPDTKLDNWTVNRYINAGGGKITGIELQWNHGFDNGFGFATNYTLANGTAPEVSYLDRVGVFTGSSKHNLNLVGYYENQDYSARLAYNWRSKYMIRETGFYGNREHDAYGTLDASLGWNINKTFRVTLEVNNILKADDVQYGAAAANNSIKPDLRIGYPAWSYLGERTIKLGVSAKF